MTQRAAHLVDAVLPAVPVRQWVLTPPYRLRYPLARDHGLTCWRCTRRRCSDSTGARPTAMASRDVCTGTLTVVQHFGSGLNLNVHFHTVAFDGVFSRTPAGALTFPPATRPVTRRWRTCLALSAPRSVHFRIGAWVFEKLKAVQGRECQPPELADIFDPAGLAMLSRSRSKPHRKNSIVGQIWSRFPPANEMWGYAQRAVRMPEPVFTENSDGLVYLKTLQGAFTR